MANRGILYPFTISANGFPEEAKDEVLVASALTQLFSQATGERVYADGNGLNLEQFVFENESALTKAGARREVVQAVSRFEGRVSIVRVPVTYSVSEGRTILDLVLLWRYQNRVFSTARPVALDNGGQQ